MIESIHIPSEQRQALRHIRLGIFDVDDTLVFARDRAFYKQYGEKVELAIAEHYETTRDRAGEIAGFYRSQYGGGEQALFRGDAGNNFSGILNKEPDVSILYDHMVQIDPRGHFGHQDKIRAALQETRDKGIKVAALTSSPDMLSRAILAEAGYDPDNDFDMFRAYDRETGPPKMIGARAVFADIASGIGVHPYQVIAVGDSLRHDVEPAISLGMMGCLLAPEAVEGYDGMRADHILHVMAELALTSGRPTI